MTFNNYTDETVSNLVEWAKAKCDYYIIGKEVAGTGTRHLQCMFCLKDKQRMTALKKAFAPWASPHMEPAAAEGQKAADYCKKGSQSHDEWTELGHMGPNFGKDADYIEGGVLPDMRRGAAATAKRIVDYAGAIELAKKRKFDEIDPSLLLRYYGNLQRIAADNPPVLVNLAKPCAEWIYGPPGTGKSWTARYENPVFYWKACTKWWDGYKGEDVVLIDDFDLAHRYLGHCMKIWLDEYAFGAEIKGSSMLIRPKKIIITSNYHPNQIWGESSPGKGDADVAMIEAVSRRVTFRWMSEPVRFMNETVEGDAYASNFNRVQPELPFESFLESRSPPVATPPPRDETNFELSDSQVRFFDLTQDF